MDETWKTRFENAMARRNEGDERAFVQAAEEARGQCTRDVARVLLKSFTDQPDHGTQEHVLSSLASAAPVDMVEAVLDELPRLLREAREWAVVLVGQELQFRPALLVQVARQSSGEVRCCLDALLRSGEVRSQFPTAEWVVSQLM